MFTRWEVHQSDELKDFEGHLLTLIIANHDCLKKLAIHMEELEQKIFVERECNLALTYLINHHERDAILFSRLSVVDHVHIYDVVFNNNVITLAEGRQVLRVSCPYAHCTITCSRAIGKFLSFVLFIFDAQVQHDVEDALAEVKAAQATDQLPKLGLVAHLDPIQIC